jgi:hypothetical protein
MKGAWAILLTGMVLAACEEPFNPIVEGERPFTVFALLNTAADTQVVRVHGSVLPSIDDPGYPEIPGTSVTISSSSGQWSFKDTLVIAASVNVKAFFAPNVVPVPGLTYQLMVHTDAGDASAVTTVPGRCEIFCGVSFILQDPSKYPLDELIVGSAALAPEAYGYLIRLVIEYERSTPEGWTVQHDEVPLMYRLEADPLYPEPRRRTTKVAAPGTLQSREAAYYSNRLYIQALKVIPRGTPVRWRRALFIVSQTDRHFFSYYSISNGFRDPNSIRIDRPDYSNIIGALGVFGSLTSDTLAISLPARIDLPEL